jgi:hypothetical protein
VHPAGAVLNEYQDIQPLQQNGVDVHEVDCEDPGGLGVQELSPGRARAARRGADACIAQAEYPANHQIDDLEQHLASQPAPLPGRKRQRSSAHAIEYSSGTGLKGAEAILTDQQRRLRREYRRFHLTREHERLYPATPQGH